MVLAWLCGVLGGRLSKDDYVLFAGGKLGVLMLFNQPCAISVKDQAST